MKCIVLAVLCLSFFGATLGNSVTVVETAPKPLELQLKAGSDLVTEDDKLLMQKLASLELSQRNAVSDLIADILESLRVVVVYGNDILPPLDPLRLPSIGPVQFSTTGIRVTANLHDFNAQGLRWYVVDEVSFNVLRLAISVHLTVPWMSITGSYDAHALITLFQHHASGNYRMFINRFETSVDLRLGTNILGGGTLILREFNIDLKIHDVQLHVDDFMGSGILNGMISNMVQGIAQNLLIDELQAIGDFLSTELFDVINEVLGNFTLDDLLGNSLA